MTSASKSPASDAYPVVHLLRQLSPSLVHDAAETISAHIPVQPALRVISLPPTLLPQLSSGLTTKARAR